MLARMSSASLVQANGCGWSFQLPVNAPMVSVSWRTEVNEPRRMDWQVITEKKHSTRLIHEHPVGVKCRGYPLVLRAGEPLADVGVLAGCIVVADDMQVLAGIGSGDLLEEAQEFLVAVAGIARIGDLAGGGVQRGGQAGHAMPDVVVRLPFRDTLPHRQDRLCPFQAWHCDFSSTQTTTAFPGGCR